jgi:ribosomal protein S8
MNKQTIFFLNRLKNASLSRKETVKVLATSTNVNIAQVLYNEGFIQSYIVENRPLMQDNYLVVFLRNYNDASSFNRLKILSTLSREKNFSFSEILSLSTRGQLIVLSTKRGIFSLKTCIRLRLGGILMFSC